MEVERPRKVDRTGKISAKKTGRTSSGRGAAASRSTDAVEISSMAQFMEKVSKLPEVRIEKIMRVKKQIEKGEYETEEKINIAIDRLLSEIGV